LRAHHVVEPAVACPQPIQNPRFAFRLGRRGHPSLPESVYERGAKNPNRSYTRFRVFADTSFARSAPAASTDSSSEGSTRSSSTRDLIGGPNLKTASDVAALRSP